MAKRYKVVVSYDGTAYYGWQVQKTLPTVAGTMQRLFQKIFKRDISLLGASRTDAGVHALGQVATFVTDLAIGPEQLAQAWNNCLPPDIIIRSLELVEDSYNPHNNIDYKLYRYHLFTSRPSPFNQRYGWFYRYPIDFEKLNDCLQVFVGTHDYRSFCTGDDMGENTVRSIDSIAVSYVEQLEAYRIEIKGPRFLHHMLRRIVGASLDVATRAVLTSDYLVQVLAEKNPRQALINAAAQGLCLADIVYKKG